MRVIPTASLSLAVLIIWGLSVSVASRRKREPKFRATSDARRSATWRFNAQSMDLRVLSRFWAAPLVTDEQTS